MKRERSKEKVQRQNDFYERNRLHSPPISISNPPMSPSHPPGFNLPLHPSDFPGFNELGLHHNQFPLSPPPSPQHRYNELSTCSSPGVLGSNPPQLSGLVDFSPPQSVNSQSYTPVEDSARPSKIRRQGSKLLSVLRSLTNSGEFKCLRKLASLGHV